MFKFEILCEHCNSAYFVVNRDDVDPQYCTVCSKELNTWVDDEDLIGEDFE